MISIIIPVLNEAETIEKLLFHLIDNALLENITEIIVVDGGSIDDSVAIAGQYGATVLNTAAGRADRYGGT